MRKNLPELTIRYDRRKRCFVLAASRKGSIRSKEKPNRFSVEWPIEELKTHADSGEKVIGAAVLAFFDQVSESGLGLKDYRTQAQLDEKRIVADLKVSSKNNDSSAQYSLAMLLLRRAAKERSLKDVKAAEKWLRAAAKGGNKDASIYLKESWSSAARAITDRIRTR